MTGYDLEYTEAAIQLLEMTSIEMIAHRNDAYPQECVGIVCSDGAVARLINQSRSHKRFIVSETLVNEVIETLVSGDHRPVAMYHSHPNGDSSPSSRDINMMKTMPRTLSFIVGHDGISAWRWDDGLESIHDGLKCVGKIPMPERTRL